MTNKVLVIDDEEHLRRMIRLTLEASGYEVGEAPDGTTGLELFADGSHWTAVVLDQRMPGIDGLETLRRIKERDPQACVVMATAYASIELAVEAMKLGASDFVRKPMTPGSLRAALQAAINKKGSVVTRNHTQDHPESHLIPTLTLNGFEILKLDNEPHRLDEQLFTVKAPDGHSRPVVVEISAEVIGFVERLTHRLLPATNSFWAMQAERLLGDYLWNEGDIPANGRLVLSDLSAEKLIVAERWPD
ncbi:MAG TPA: response regulator [Pyrinomonadaceae bacterium]|nr:response regulator [Pyrinomonadaceae bacterium]